MTWKQLTERDCSRLSTLMIDIPEIWCEICHVCSKPAIWKGGPLMWMLLLFLHINKKNLMMMILKLINMTYPALFSQK